jgi:transcriptional regulator with XRE-family HTH domain
VISRDRLSENLGMMTPESELRWRYIRRIAELRDARGMTQQEMADALGIPLERYKKYEQRSVLPPWYLDRFAAVIGKDIGFVVTGRTSRGPRAARNSADRERGSG